MASHRVGADLPPVPPISVMQLLPALDGGGVERSTIEVAQALAAAGHRAIVVSAGGRWLPRLLATGAEHVELAIGRKSLASLRHVWTLRRLIRSLRPDIVHARSRLPAWLAWYAIRGLPAGRRPHFVTTVHGLNSVGRYSAIMARGERVIAVSQTVRAHLLEHYPLAPERIAVIPRGIDPAQWPWQHPVDPHWRAAQLARRPQLAGKRLLLLPGRGTRLKGHGEAIDLLAALVARDIDAALWLLGADQPGRERYVAELQQQARRSGVDDRVVIDPASDQVREAMAMADVVLQLSTKPESFGRTVIEALALGRPVLGWDHGGVGELLRACYPDGAVALHDRAALIDRATNVLRSPGPMAAPEGYTLARMQTRTLQLYAELSGAVAPS